MQFIPEFLSDITESVVTIYRGHADCSWELKPSIGRHYTGDEWLNVINWEIKSLNEFKKQSLPHLKITPKSDIECLCLMQHHGCATRLLDFTSNPLIALFFASDPNIRADGEVISAKYGRTYENVSDDKLFNRTHDFAYFPPHITDRIVNQSGCFVFSRKPNAQLGGKRIERIKVPKDNKKGIRSELAQLGISYSSLFPGIDGVCQDLNDDLVLDLEFSSMMDT